MKTLEHSLARTAKKSSQPMAIHTTLYDLIAALSAEVGPDEEDVLTATVVHLLNSHRVTCTGNLQGSRLVCNMANPTAPVSQSDDDLASYFET